jgi:SAM-dependent methyltransferase
VNLKGARAERFGALASRLYRRWAEPTLEPLYRRVAAEVPIDHGRLLDVGCGPGRLARLVAVNRPGLSVLGIDASPDMIGQARREQNPPNLEFRHGAVESTRFEAEFDFALTLLSFHHWEEPVDGLRAIHRALAPGARLWIYEPDSEASDNDIRRDHLPLWGWLRLPGWFHRRMSRGHGFSLGEVDGAVRPAVAKTPFGECRVERRGSTIRIELVRR